MALAALKEGCGETPESQKIPLNRPPPPPRFAGQFEADCRLWCTGDGSLPTWHDADEDDKDLRDTIASLLNNSRVVEDVDLEGNSPAVCLSPHAIYALGGGSGERWTFQGKWARAEERCHAHLTCPVLEGNTCADFGISVEFGNGSRWDVCRAGRSYRQ